jgi:hypothetical protein
MLPTQMTSQFRRFHCYYLKEFRNILSIGAVTIVHGQKLQKGAFYIYILVKSLYIVLYRNAILCEKRVLIS